MQHEAIGRDASGPADRTGIGGRHDRAGARQAVIHEKPPRARRHAPALREAVAAVRSTDPATVESAVRQLGRRRRWLVPLAYAAGTVAIVFDGVVLLIRNWRLTLLQLLPAAWIAVMTWNLRTHLLEEQELPAGISPVVAVGVLIAAQVAYWCNATFGYAMLQRVPDIGAAFREALPHWRFVGGLALLTGGVQAAIWLVLPEVGLRWFWIALLAMFVVQVYLFVAIPSWLIGARPTGTRRERAMQKLTTGVLSGVAATPGFLLNRIGLLLLGVGALWWLGVAVLAVSAVLHVTASSSVRVVKMSVRLHGDPDRPGTAAR
jgi:hypothetical protein